MMNQHSETHHDSVVTPPPSFDRIWAGYGGNWDVSAPVPATKPATPSQQRPPRPAATRAPRATRRVTRSRTAAAKKTTGSSRGDPDDPDGGDPPSALAAAPGTD